jgi:hypothetical protein
MDINLFWNSLLNIAQGVISNFIFAGIIWLLGNRERKPLPVNPLPEIERQLDIKPLNQRNHNRAIAEAATHHFLFYLLTFGVLYLSIIISPLFKALFSNVPLLLNHTKFIGEYLPAIPISSSYFQASFFIVAAIIYIPLLVISKIFTSIITPFIDAFTIVTNQIWSTITILTFFILCVPIAATSIWLFYSKSFSSALSMVFALLCLALAFGTVQNRK